MKLLLAAAADGSATTNTAKALIQPGHGLVARFEEATGLPREAAVWSVNILAALLLLVGGYIIAGILRKLVRNLFDRRGIDPIIGRFVSTIVHVSLMIFVAITALGQMGVDTKTFAAAIAAAGLAIGLALQGGLSNFAAGILIVVFRPFRAGDMINGAGVEGKVEEVQIFSTALNTVDNKRLIVPNSALLNGTITNFTTNATRRVDLALEVGAGQDLERVHAALIALAVSDARVVKEPAPAVANARLIIGGTQVELRVWCKTADYAALLEDLIARAPITLAEAGIKGPDKTVYYVERK